MKRSLIFALPLISLVSGTVSSAKPESTIAASQLKSLGDAANANTPHKTFLTGSSTSDSELSLFIDDALTTVAQSPPVPPPERHEGNSEPPFLRDLNLTADQQKRVQEIIKQSREGTESLRQQMRSASDQMRSLMASNTPADQLRKQHQQIQNLRQQIDNQFFETMLAIREVLTPEQRSRLSEAMDKHRGKPPMPPSQ